MANTNKALTVTIVPIATLTTRIHNKHLTTNTKTFTYCFIPEIDITLVTSKHWDKTNFLAFLTQHLIIVDAAKQLATKMQDYYNVETAVGTQLDILGELVGVSRYVNFEPSVDSPTLDDTTYRFCIKAKIAQNQWDGTIPGLYTIWYALFPLFLISVVDNQDMTCDINFTAQNFTTLQKELITNGYIIPKTQCVHFDYNWNGTFSFNDSLIVESSSSAGMADLAQTTGGELG